MQFLRIAVSISTNLTSHKRLRSRLATYATIHKMLNNINMQEILPKESILFTLIIQFFDFRQKINKCIEKLLRIDCRHNQRVIAS